MTITLHVFFLDQRKKFGEKKLEGKMVGRLFSVGSWSISMYFFKIMLFLCIVCPSN